MKMKMKNRSHRYKIHKPRFRHGHKYSKYKKYLSMMILICIKQFMKTLSNTEAELKKSVAYKKSVYFSETRNLTLIGFDERFYVSREKNARIPNYCLNVLQHFFSPTLGSDILATPPSLLMSAGTLSNAITAQAY